MQVTNHSNNIRKMKEEMLEAIYGTVERLEQKVDELSASPKNTELPENKKTESRKSKHRKTPRVHQAEKREQVKGKIHER